MLMFAGFEMMLTKVFLVPPVAAQASKHEPRFEKRYSVPDLVY